MIMWKNKDLVKKMNLLVSNRYLHLGDHKFPCAIGRSGVGEKNQEGDGATPVGRFPLRQVFYRADRLDQPKTVLPIRALTPEDGWCDDPQDVMHYNRHVLLPISTYHEKLYRDDHVYDIIVVIGFNDDPVKLGFGSAIFMHIAREHYLPTEGCIALAKKDLVQILTSIALKSSLIILND